MLTHEQALTTCLNTIEHYLQEKKIEFEKLSSKSGSIYYHIKLWNGEPRIRVSDHPFKKDEEYKLCSLSIIYTQIFGKNSNTKKVRQRVISMLNNLIKSHSTYHLHKTMNKLTSKNKDAHHEEDIK